MNGDRAENLISLLRQAKSVLSCFFFLLFFYRGIFFSFPFTRFSRVVFKRPSKFNLFILHRGIITIIKRVPPSGSKRGRAPRRSNSRPIPAPARGATFEFESPSRAFSPVASNVERGRGFLFHYVFYIIHVSRSMYLDVLLRPPLLSRLFSHPPIISSLLLLFHRLTFVFSFPNTRIEATRGVSIFVASSPHPPRYPPPHLFDWTFEFYFFCELTRASFFLRIIINTISYVFLMVDFLDRGRLI